MTGLKNSNVLYTKNMKKQVNYGITVKGRKKNHFSLRVEICSR